MTQSIDHARLARQSLCRPLTPEENALAKALEQIFSEKTHDFALVADELENRQVKRPSGEKGKWTGETLLYELKRINDGLDRAYEAHDPVNATM